RLRQLIDGLGEFGLVILIGAVQGLQTRLFECDSVAEFPAGPRPRTGGEIGGCGYVDPWASNAADAIAGLIENDCTILDFDGSGARRRSAFARPLIQVHERRIVS